jgi:acetylglutamate kinase
MQDTDDPDKQIFLFKYGGNAMTNSSLKKEILSSICSLKSNCLSIVIVHGGGPFIGQALEDAKIESEFIDGHRKTTSEAFEYVEMALKGKVNGSLTGIINALGYKAVGLSGKDGNTVIATKRLHKRIIDGKAEDIDLGQVGDVAKVDTSLIRLLIDHDYIPVITCLASDASGVGFNINADMFAGHIAGALGATEYIVLTDVDGLLRDKDDPGTLIEKLQLPETTALIEEGVIAGGMIPKIESCEIAINKGASAARIINGTKPDQISAMMKQQETGTLIIK